VYLEKIDLFMTERVRAKLASILKEAMGTRTQRHFAKQLGVSHVTLRSWLECEGFPSQESCEKIAAFRGQTLDALLQDLRGEEIIAKSAEDFLPIIDGLSKSEMLRLADLLIERAGGGRFQHEGR
jgi:transcriptional regulator with XRE-family HTH domain